jgi:hypothetical protein
LGGEELVANRVTHEIACGWAMRTSSRLPQPRIRQYFDRPITGKLLWQAFGR